MSHDYLSISDEKLVDLLQGVYTTCVAHLTAWGLSQTELDDWHPELTAFTTAVDTLKTPANRSPVATRIKNDARKALDTKVRPFIQGRLIRNTKVTPADLVSMGLPVHDTHPTPKPPPRGRPALEAKPSNNRQHTVTALDQLTGSKTKPDDAYGVKYAWEIRDTPPVNADDLRHSVFNRRTVHVFDYNEEDRGKRVYYAAQYENAKGESGPWSDIVELLIP